MSFLTCSFVISSILKNQAVIIKFVRFGENQSHVNNDKRQNNLIDTGHVTWKTQIQMLDIEKKY